MIIIVFFSEQFMPQSHYPISIPVWGECGQTCLYGRDAVHGGLEVPMNGNDQESSWLLRNALYK